jgi:hypothetical protein
VTDALFEAKGDKWLPTDYARGPWSPEALHGGPPAALIAREVERTVTDPDLQVGRFTVELLRPIPVVPLEVRAEIVRPGHKIKVVEVQLFAEGTQVAWARVVLIRTMAQADPAIEALARGPVPGSGNGAPPLFREGHHSTPVVQGYTGFHNAGAELRFVGGEFDRRGPAQVWIRLAVPVVEDEVPSPLQRTVAAADFGNGVSSVLSFDGFSFINPDLSVYINRPAVGEWICLDAHTEMGTPGVGLAHSKLWDSEGAIGYSLQSLLVEVRR